MIRLVDPIRMVENILRIYYQATDLEKQAGERWYRDANEITSRLAYRYGIDRKQAAAVLSILSPSNRWERNVDDADTLLAAWRAGQKPTEFAVSTYNQNKLKAWWMLVENSEPDEMFGDRAPKTRAFYNLLHDPDSGYVTIDGHAFGIAMGVRTPLQGNEIPGLEYRDRYNRITRAFHHAAERSHWLVGHQLQAVTWLAWRRIHNV